MIAVNPLGRKTLITTKEVIYHAPTQHTIDPRTIQQAIIIAEERFIRPALTTALYEAIAADKHEVVDDINIGSYQSIIDAQQQPGAAVISLEVGNLLNDAYFLNDRFKALWNTILWKLTAECVIFTAYPEGFIQFSSSGLVHSNPPAGVMMNTTSNLTTPDLKSVKWIMDKKMQDRIDPLIAALHIYLCQNITLYPEYGKPCDCDVNGVAYKRKSDFIMGLFDEEDANCGCD